MTRPDAPSGSAAVYPAAGASDTDQSDVGQRGLGELVKEVTEDLTKLLNQELELAKAEVKIEAKKAGKTGAAFGGAGLAGYFMILFASLTLLFALASWWDSFTWAALAVTVLWGIVGAVLYMRAKKQAAELNPKPELTIQTLKEGVR